MPMSPITPRHRRAPRAAAVVSMLAAIGLALTIALSAWPAAGGAGGGEAPTTTPPSETSAQRAGPADANPGRRRGRRAERRRPASDAEAVDWRRSVAVGVPTRGALRKGVKLPATGLTYVTWDPVRRTRPNRPARRYATAALLRVLLKVTAAYSRAHTSAPRVVVGDLSRPRGGDFGIAHGDLGDGKGHVSHQTGLDVDVYYPHTDGRERGATGAGPEEVVPFVRSLAQDLVDRFVAAGATAVFVGTRSGLTGPPGVVKAVPRHNDHMHVRFAAPRGA